MSKAVGLAFLLMSSPLVAADRVPLYGANAEVCFTPGTDCARIVATAIEGARDRVWLMGYGFSEGVILGALKDARERSLDVRVILDRSNDDGSKNSGAGWIARHGIPVWIDRSVQIAHNKLVLIDADTVVLGSMNWTRFGRTKNAENVHVVRAARALAERHAAYFLDRQAASDLYKVALPGPMTRR